MGKNVGGSRYAKERSMSGAAARTGNLRKNEIYKIIKDRRWGISGTSYEIYEKRDHKN